MATYYFVKNDELYHYGIKGMKWGVRKAKEASEMRRKGNTPGDIIGYNVNRQLKIAKSERNRHTTAGHIVSAMGKNVVHGMAIGIPLGLIFGNRNPIVNVGASVVGSMLAVNYAAEAGARIYYKYNTKGGKKKKK